MTQEEIRTQRDQHRNRIDELRGEIEIEVARWKVLEKRCKHPAGYPTSCMGDAGWHCPDCGYTR